MTPASREWQRHKVGLDVLIVHLLGIGAALITAAFLTACGGVATRIENCDAEIAHAELISCVTDADVPEGPEQTAQVVAWCAARAALKGCRPVREAALRQGVTQ